MQDENTPAMQLRIAQEQARLHQFAQEADSYLAQLAENLRSDFNSTLNRMVSEDLAQFQRQVESVFSSLGLAEVGSSVSSGVARLLGDVFRDGSSIDMGGIFTSALGAALGRFGRTGTFDAHNLFKAGYYGAGRGLSQSLRVSRGQQGAASLKAHRHAQRNL